MIASPPVSGFGTLTRTAVGLGCCLLAACGGSSSSGQAAGGSPSGGTAPSNSAGLSGTSGGAATADSPSPSPTPTPAAQLPRGGTKIFPKHFVVMYYGTAGTDALGVLGEGSPDEAAAKVEKAAKPFAAASKRTVLPAFELITTVAQRAPGDNGDYSEALADADVQKYLDAARKGKLLLVLDLQPGRADFLAQAKRYEKFLKEPDVGLALDPEWVLKEGQRPGKQIGSTTAADVNRVSAYLAKLTADNKLPEKLFLLHQFRLTMIKNREDIVKRPGLATVLHVDGFGTKREKLDTYGVLSLKKNELINAYKLFYDEDKPLMSPTEVLALKPPPQLVSYQ